MLNFLVSMETTVTLLYPILSCVNNYQTFLKKLVKIDFCGRKLGQYVLPKPTWKLIKN